MRRGTEPGGYGRFFANGRHHTAHRFAYEFLVGAIPEGLVIDHTCHRPPCPGGPCKHRRCVNPAHLEAVTQAVNNQRSNKTGTETHCPNGHEFTPENTYVPPSTTRNQGRRQCRICKTEAMRRFNARNPGRNHHAAD